MLQQKHGFTLIELLIVVAIIAILAAIAIPNFLAAQIRSKVSRVKADLRTYATALEAYYVDNNWYPLHYAISLTDGHMEYPYFADTIGAQKEDFCTNAITTPIAYISRQYPDPFHVIPTMGNPESMYYCYDNCDQGYIQHNNDIQWSINVNARFGKWRLWSGGPDMDRRDLQTGATGFYDPTNGTVSNGDIVRGQKSPEIQSWD